MLSERKREYDKKYQAEHTVMVTVRFNRDYDLDCLDKIDLIAKSSGKSRSKVIKDLLRGQLYII